MYTFDKNSIEHIREAVQKINASDRGYRSDDLALNGTPVKLFNATHSGYSGYPAYYADSGWHDDTTKAQSIIGISGGAIQADHTMAIYLSGQWVAIPTGDGASFVNCTGKLDDDLLPDDADVSVSDISYDDGNLDYADKKQSRVASLMTVLPVAYMPLKICQ
jgi:hypothetical protein